MDNTSSYGAGSIISVAHTMDSGRSLALVVDQEKALKWMERDPFLAYHPEDTTTNFVRVRWLGCKQAEMAIGKRGLPEEEPSDAQIERWAYAQVSLTYPVAGPDIVSMKDFLAKCRMFNRVLGNSEMPFWHDLSLVVEYLCGVTRKSNAISFYDRKYFNMLEDVLPRS